MGRRRLVTVVLEIVSRVLSHLVRLGPFGLLVSGEIRGDRVGRQSVHVGQAVTPGLPVGVVSFNQALVRRRGWHIDHVHHVEGRFDHPDTNHPVGSSGQHRVRGHRDDDQGSGRGWCRRRR